MVLNFHIGQGSSAPAKPTGWLALIVPAPAVLLGAATMRAHETETRIWGLNIAVWLGATASCVAIKVLWPRFPRLKWMAECILCFGVLSLLSTFCFPSLQGVHRWLVIDSIRLHAASIFLPVVLIALGSIHGKPAPSLAIVLTLLVAVVLGVQPDAAQATAFSGAALFLVLGRGVSRMWALFLIGGLLMCVIGVWLRPDPLPAIVYVEGIVGLALNLSPWLAAACVGALTLIPIPFIWFWWENKGTRDTALPLAFAIYFGVTLLTPLIGNFPVPVMGYGASPIIGYFIAIGCLLVQEFNERQPEASSSLKEKAT